MRLSAVQLCRRACRRAGACAGGGRLGSAGACVRPAAGWRQHARAPGAAPARPCAPPALAPPFAPPLPHPCPAPARSKDGYVSSTAELPAESAVGLVLGATSFYAEAGGQTADTGAIAAASASFDVEVCVCVGGGGRAGLAGLGGAGGVSTSVCAGCWGITPPTQRMGCRGEVLGGAHAVPRGSAVRLALPPADGPGAPLAHPACCSPAPPRPAPPQSAIVAAGYVLHLGRRPEGEIRVGEAVTTK